MVGWYLDTSGYSHGFLYNGTTWTILDMPGADATYAYGIDNGKIIGYYDVAGEPSHGFIYTIPEPATLFLLTLGGMALRTKKFKT
jgi:hypothetical protein